MSLLDLEALGRIAHEAWADDVPEVGAERSKKRWESVAARIILALQLQASGIDVSRVLPAPEASEDA